MKKIVFALIIIIGALQAKAQVFTYKIPGYKNPLAKPDTNWNKRFNFKTDSSFAKVKPSVRLNIMPKNTDNMPIAKLPVNSKMPIVQTDVTGYTMPVAGMNLPRVYTMKQTEPVTITTP